MKQQTIWIEGMMCAHCQETVQKALKAVTGVITAEVRLEQKCAIVMGTATAEVLKAAVEQAGYVVTRVE